MKTSTITKALNAIDLTAVAKDLRKAFRSSTATTVIFDKDEGQLAVKYHDTVVASFQDRSITLNNGGFYTRTTMSRMNTFLSAFGVKWSLVQRKNAWQLVNHEDRNIVMIYANDMKTTV